MRIVVGPVDVVGKLWLLEPHACSGVFEVLGASVPDFELHVTRRTAIDATIVSALCAGRSVTVYERAALFAGRAQRVAMRLREIGMSAEWRWAERMTDGATAVDDEGAALGWFLASASSTLVIETVSFEKRRRLRPPARAREHALVRPAAIA